MKKGFTLVELLAVIVILAVILVIAVPQINSVIKQTRKNSLASTAKLIASKAEEATVENEILGSGETLTCASLVKLDDNYGNCDVSVTNGVGNVTLVGAGKFAGYTCTGTKSSMNCTEGSVEEGIFAYRYISDPSGGYSDYHDVMYPDASNYTYDSDEPAQVFIKYPTTGPYTESTTKSVCTLYGGNLNCFEMNASLYSTYKNRLQTLFGSGNCTIGTGDGGQIETTNCATNDESWRCLVDEEGGVECFASTYYCYVWSDGISDCNSY